MFYNILVDCKALIVIDMYFDYFLAIHFSEYSGGKSLKMFSYHFNLAVLINYRFLPERVKRFILHFGVVFPYFVLDYFS